MSDAAESSGTDSRAAGSEVTGPHESSVGRVIGIDLGDRRIGIAVSDSARRSAFARNIIVRSGDIEKDRATLLAAIEESLATAVVVGLPLSLDGTVGPAAKKALAEVEWLTATLELPVDTIDERLTTVEATQRRNLVANEARGQRGRSHTSQRRAKRNTARVDDVAAEVLLQAFLDQHRPV